MSSRTVILSLGVHVAIAATLLGAAGKKAARRPTAVSFSEEKKKDKPAPPKPPPAPPPRVAKPVEHKVALVAKEAPAPAAHAAAPPPVETALTMTNDDDSPGGIALPSRAGAAKPAPAAAAKVASAVTDARKQRMKEAASQGEDAPCAEEPSKPVPVFKQEIEYIASARAEGIEGRLKLRLTVGADGSVTKVDVVESVAPELDASSVATAKQWRFKPALACGKPIAGGTYIIVSRFELGD